MTPSSAGPQDENWIATKATIIACRQRMLGLENLSSEGYLPPKYVVTFSYPVGDQTFQGTYRANSPQECGHDFDIFYDPTHPHKNTGSDVLDNRWYRWTAAFLGVAAVLIAIWFWGKDDWF